MAASATFREIGVVEGFYGAVWTPAARFAFIERLRPFGLNTYLHAPKHEAALAAEAMHPLSGAAAERLGALARYCTERGIRAWAGIHLEPPFQAGNADHVRAVGDKIAALAGLGYSGFAVLFDDLQTDGSGAGESTAARQGRVCTALIGAAQSAGIEADWIVCPSRYTLDPILEKEYGRFEPDYLTLLDAGLPPHVDWLWTGPRVCSPTIAPEDAAAYLGAIRRRLILWDNYPVNDAGMVQQLHLGPLSGRRVALPQAVGGYLFNPLLQPALGAIPGATCLQYAADPTAYDPAPAWERAASALLPGGSAEPLAELEALTRRSCLAEISGAPAAPGAGAESLAANFRTSWCEEGPGAISARRAGQLVGEVVDDLRAALPAEMAREAEPWLERLALAGRIAEAGKAAPGAAVKSYRAAKAHVLGPWFDP